MDIDSRLVITRRKWGRGKVVWRKVFKSVSWNASCKMLNKKVPCGQIHLKKMLYIIFFVIYNVYQYIKGPEKACRVLFNFINLVYCSVTQNCLTLEYFLKNRTSINLLRYPCSLQHTLRNAFLELLLHSSCGLNCKDKTHFDPKPWRLQKTLAFMV